MDENCLRVESLGPLRVFAGGQEITLGPPKQCAVFAVLALNANSAVSRDELIDHLWGESPPATAAGNLHTYMSNLRRALAVANEPLTSSGSGGYMLQLEPERLDVRVVERLAVRARTSCARHELAAALASLDEALAYWRPGSPLSGLPGPFAAEHRAWASEFWLRLLMERAELLLRLGRPAEVVDQLRGQVRANPFHERLRALLMTALRCSGRTADALAQYQDLRKSLAGDLGIDPSAELQALHSSMLADDAGTQHPQPGPAALAVTAASVRPAQLPRGVGNFVGRVASIQQVLDISRATSVTGSRVIEGMPPQIAMIVGVGGVGKTALAVHCAHLLAADYPDGQLYVNLRGLDPRHPVHSPVDALYHLLSSLNVTAIPAEHEQRVALWRSIVRDKNMLIVLDNAESADQVEDLLPGGGPSFVIVTSRNRLSRLAVRYSACRVPLSLFTIGESLELLSDSIGSSQVSAELSAAQRLAELCDHLPLALRIASEQVATRPLSRIADLATDLENVQRRLDLLQIPDDELNSVRAVLSWSYARLDVEAARAFRALGLFPGGSILPEAAAALLGLPLPATATALQHLADQNLVQVADGRYWIHDLTHIYAKEVSHESETNASRRQIVERVLRWYVRTLSQDSKPSGARLPFTLDRGSPPEPLHFDDQEAFLVWCTQEWDNLAPLVRTAQQSGCHEQAWQLAYLLSEYFYTAEQAQDWIETLRIGMRSAKLIENQRAQSCLQSQLNVAYSRIGSLQGGL